MLLVKPSPNIATLPPNGFGVYIISQMNKVASGHRTELFAYARRRSFPVFDLCRILLVFSGKEMYNGYRTLFIQNTLFMEEEYDSKDWY